MSKLIVVIGLTGNQGGSVAEVFTKEAGWKVRGVTRNAGSAAAAAWAAKGVEVVEADLDDKASLVRAFAGAHAVFGVTNFWGLAFDPASQAKLAPGQTSVLAWSAETEHRQGMNVAEAAAATPGLERFVFSALADARRWSAGKFANVLHFDSKAHVVDQVKEEMPALAQKMSVLYMGYFMSNWETPASHPTKQADGSFRLSCVGSGDRKIPFVHTPRDTGYLVRALLQVEAGKTLLGVGAQLTFKEAARIWCETLGVAYGGYDAVPLESFVSYFPMGPAFGRELGEMFAFMDEFGYDGSDPSVVYPKDLGVPIPLTSWEQYCKETDWSKAVAQ